MVNGRTGSLSSRGEAIVFMAIELSKKGWLVAMRGPMTDRISLHRLSAGDARGVIALAERVRAAAVRELGIDVMVASCYEAGYDGFWLHRVLTDAGVSNHARRAKTDRIDAQALLRALMAYRRGEGRVSSVVQPSTPEEEDARRTHRERQNLLKERGRHVNRIKGLCALQGILDYEPMRGDRHKRLTESKTGDGRPLQPRLLPEILRELARLEVLLRQIEVAPL